MLKESRRVERKKKWRGRREGRPCLKEVEVEKREGYGREGGTERKMGAKEKRKKGTKSEQREVSASGFALHLYKCVVFFYLFFFFKFYSDFFFFLCVCVCLFVYILYER